MFIKMSVYIMEHSRYCPLSQQHKGKSDVYRQVTPFHHNELKK